MFVFWNFISSICIMSSNSYPSSLVKKQPYYMWFDMVGIDKLAQKIALIYAKRSDLRVKKIQLWEEKWLYLGMWYIVIVLLPKENYVFKFFL